MVLQTKSHLYCQLIENVYVTFAFWGQNSGTPDGYFFPELDLLRYEEEQPSANICILARDNFLSAVHDLDTRLC
jgi:hypothetical protein